MDSASSTPHADPCGAPPDFGPNAVQAVGLLILMVVGVHSPAFFREFVWDDLFFLSQIQNQGSWNLLQPDLFGFLRPGKAFLFSLQESFLGSKPGAWAAFNMLTALAQALLLFRFLLFFAKALPAFLATLAFAVHPHHVESTFWSSANNGAWVTVFTLLAFIGLVQFTELRKMRYALLVVLSALLAPLFKEEAVALPVLLSLLAVGLTLRLPETPKKPLALICLSSGVACWGVMIALRLLSPEVVQELDTESFAGYNPLLIGLHAPWILLLHMGYAVAPFFWAYYQVYSPPFWFLMTGSVVGWLFWGAVLQRGIQQVTKARLNLVLLGLALYALAMAPNSNLLAFKNDWFGVRYLSVGSIGLSLGLCGILTILMERSRANQKRLTLAVVCWAMAATLFTVLGHRGWANEEVFFRHLVEHNQEPRYERLYNQVLLSKRKLAEAEKGILKLMESPEAKAEDYTQLAFLRFYQGQIVEAVKAGETALELDPENGDTLLLLGYCFEEIYTQSRDSQYLQRAAQQYSTAMEAKFVQPENRAAAYDNFARLLAMSGKLEDAVRVWQAGLQLFPYQPQLNHNLSLALKDLENRSKLQPPATSPE